MTHRNVDHPDVPSSELFIRLRARVNALRDQGYEEVEAIARESLKLKSSDEKTRLVCLIYGQTGEAPYEMEVKTVHLRRGGLLEGPTIKAASLG